MSNTYFKIDHRYNKKPQYVPSSSSFRQDNKQTIVPTMSQSSDIVSVVGINNKNKPVTSFRCQIHDVLQEWQRLQQEKKKYEQQQQQQQQSERKRPGFWGDKNQVYDEFDRIMEEDLENQLKELERQEEEQYKRVEQILEEQLQKNPNNNEENDEFERYCMELLEEYEKKEVVEQMRIIPQDKSSQSSNQVLNINVDN
ncbi:unnamed protein product [Adineta steineri]|uniref:Uncharacterized protein n=1 Tax=Adineta steineri TaxID=433720 RepID=A0A815F138_9BILA|nr:unnamed protein product [Adineta steineri]CAF3554384.1 unnamed protein product [Adineta steineri]